MKTRIAINGFGRIGRNLFKVAFERSDIEIVAINDVASPEELAYLLQHDTTYGAYQHKVGFDASTITINGVAIKIINVQEPDLYPWRDFDVDVLVEAMDDSSRAHVPQLHLDAGAKRVVSTVPTEGSEAAYIVLGVNEDALDDRSLIISTGTSTAMCAGPVLAVLESTFGAEKALINSIHSYTAAQRLVDGVAGNARLGRSGAQNIVPDYTKSGDVLASIFPKMAGNVNVAKVFVPTQVVSLIDCVIVLKRNVSVEEVNDALSRAAGEPYYQGILTVNSDKLVSSDYIGNSHSSIVDLDLTAVTGGNIVRVVAWYDNEWGYSNRLVEVVADVGRLLHESSLR